MKKKTFALAGILILACIVAYAPPASSAQGVRYLFSDKQFNYQAFRALGHASYGGALSGEVLSVIPRITDDESWKREWSAMAEKCEKLARQAADPVSKGNALLRASNYYRTAEFFIDPSGKELEEKRSLHHKSVLVFQEAIKALGIRHSMARVPWEKGGMLFYYFPGQSNKPVIFLHGGFDSTNEENYFFAGAALIARGYPVVMFEGPGQSGMIRDFGVRFTPRWHEPVGRIFDFMTSAYPELAQRKKILVGVSLGGLLAGRAAAFEKRIDGVVLFGAPYDMADAALFQMPQVMRRLYREDVKGPVNAAVVMKAKWDRGLRWGMKNGMWTIGGDTPVEMIKAFEAYTLKDIQDKVQCRVLCIYGEKDIYVADDRQMALFRQSFKNAAGYTLKVFREEAGSAEHCQIGAVEQAVQEIVVWLTKSGFTD